MFISDDEAIRYILQVENRYVCYLGAGASVEAGVMTAQGICEAIRKELLDHSPFEDQNEKERWVDEILVDWNDPSQRYVTCIRKGYRTPAARVEYFRQILKNIRPSFCHHAVALLMRGNCFKTTCLTTNFDKLLESAFTQQGELECQPIRGVEESGFWQHEPNRYYVMKLHGDYDTHNILNTEDETLRISDSMISIIERVLESAGMVVIGSAGNEKSIRRMFDDLASKATGVSDVLSFGLLWGVYMGQPKPKNMTPDKLEELINDRIRQEVGRDIVKMIERKNPQNELFCFFPVWGAGAFLFDLIKATHENTLIREAELYLDHEMRLRNVFTGAGLSEAAITEHISNLKKSQDKLKERQDSGSPKSDSNGQELDLACEIHGKNTAIEIRVMYGDITSRGFMAKEEFQSSIRAILSPEDTFLTAGGGVAYTLLNKAGKYNILNELAKLSPIEQGAVAVTSGGNLPVHYIFHAAAIKIEEDAKYSVTKASVRKTMTAALEKALALEVSTLLVPLMGSGVAGLSHAQSLAAILKAVHKWNKEDYKMTIIIVIYMEKHLPRHAVEQCAKRTLGSQFHVTKFS